MTTDFDFQHRYTQRMFRAFGRLDDSLREQEQAIQNLKSGVEAVDGIMLQDSDILARVITALADMSKLHDKIRIEMSKIGGATGHLMESGEVLHDTSTQFADLTTLAQYGELAPLASVGYNRDVLQNVELPIFEEALGAIELDRLLLIEAAISRVINKKRG